MDRTVLTDHPLGSGALRQAGVGEIPGHSARPDVKVSVLYASTYLWTPMPLAEAINVWWGQLQGEGEP